MKYAKLLDGYPQFAPNPIYVDGNLIGNPPAEQYLQRGYKPVQFSKMPGISPGFYAEESWSDTGESILQSWTVQEDPNLSDGEALQIILGGDAL